MASPFQFAKLLFKKPFKGHRRPGKM